MKYSMKHIRIWLLLLILALLPGLCGCSFFDRQDGESEETSQSEAEAEEAPEYPVEAGGAQVAARPGWIVSLSPALTDKLFDLGRQDRLSGVSNFCTLPDGGDLDSLPRCGTAQLPDLEAIEALDAHLLLSESPLSQADAAALRQMGVDVAVFSHAASVEDLMGTYLSISMLLDGKRTGAMFGERFVGLFEERLDALSARYPGSAGEGEPKNALYLRLLDFTVATGETLESELLERVGLANIAGDQTGWNYPAEAANAEKGRAAFASLDVIFCDERYVTIKMLEQSDYYHGLQAVLKDWYYYIDCTRFERQSLAMLDTLEEMAGYAYPEVR